MSRRRGNGEGSITRHKNSGLYMARYTVQTPNGPQRKTIYMVRSERRSQISSQKLSRTVPAASS
jgi:hypothetical protein